MVNRDVVLVSKRLEHCLAWVFRQMQYFHLTTTSINLPIPLILLDNSYMLGP